MDQQNNKDILKEINELNQSMRNPDNQTFKRTTYWHQQSKTVENINQETLLKEIIGYLQRIEGKIIAMEAFLEK